ncbi:MAG TPA: hypothetical protein VGI60_12290 [Chthoniobacterales bacterium]|jgi:hypothetical protein
MRLAVPLILLCAVSSVFPAELAGRWEGSIAVPDRALTLVVDLEQTVGKGWIGSVTIPILDVKGAPLAELSIKGDAITGTIKGALASIRVEPAKLQGRLTTGELRGNFFQAGNSAPFVLHKIGPAQVELPRVSTPVGQDLVGEWKGDFELLGYPRHVTLTLANHKDAAATATLVIVGKRTTNAPIDFVADESGYLTVTSQETGLGYEGRLHAGQFRGTFHLGSTEFPLILRHNSQTP